MRTKWMTVDAKQLQRFEVFNTQDTENGHFDVTFLLGDEKLYAHKHMLAGLSKPFAAMFSERWKTKDEPIKVDNYTFNDFKEFLSHFYFSKPQITHDNVFTMVDLAEYYDVAEVKDKCDEYLSEEMEITPENVVEMFEFSLKYPSLSFFSSSLMNKNLSCLMESNGFLNVKKEMLKSILNLERFYSMEGQLFQAVYKWAARQAIIKNTPTRKAIKEELAELLPKIYFERMDLDFLIAFVVPKDFLFSSNQDLSEILRKVTQREVSVTVSGLGDVELKGKISCDSSELMRVYDAITLAEYSTSFDDDSDDEDEYEYWITERSLVSNLSGQRHLKKDYDVNHYLLIDANENLAVKETTLIGEEDHLLAELSGQAGSLFHLKIEAVCTF